MNMSTNNNAATRSLYTKVCMNQQNSYFRSFHFANDSWKKLNIGNQKQLSKSGQLYQNKVFLNDNVVKKLIYINKLELPDVLIDIIKDYLYNSCEVLFHKILTNRFCEKIKCIRINSWKMIGENDNIVYEHELEYYIDDVFGINYYRPTATFKYYFCSQCGNYTNDYLYGDESYSYNALCRCDTHPYYQSYDGIQDFRTEMNTIYK